MIDGCVVMAVRVVAMPFGRVKVVVLVTVAGCHRRLFVGRSSAQMGLFGVFVPLCRRLMGYHGALHRLMGAQLFEVLLADVSALVNEIAEANVLQPNHSRTFARVVLGFQVGPERPICERSRLY